MAATLVLSAAAYPAFAAAYALLAWYVQYEHLPAPSVLTIVVPGVLCALTFIPDGKASKTRNTVAVAVWTGEGAKCGNEFPRQTVPSTPTKRDASAIEMNMGKRGGMMGPSCASLNARVPPSRASRIPTSPVSPNQW